MKILVAIKCQQPEQITAGAMPWAARAGFNARVFVRKNANLPKYHAAIDNLNYDQYLDAQYAMIVCGTSPKEYAKATGYDILVQIPASLERWSDARDLDKRVLEYATEIGAVRKRMADDPTLKKHAFDNGVVVERLA